MVLLFLLVIYPTLLCSIVFRENNIKISFNIKTGVKKEGDGREITALDDFDAEDIYNQICEQRRRRGYVDYSELVV